MKIAILTSGGDSPGMNATIINLLINALASNHEVVFVVADEIQNHHKLLVLVFSKSPSKLLDEDDWRLGWPYKQNLVDFWNVNTLIEDINREDVFKLIWIAVVCEAVDCFKTLFLRIITSKNN